MRSKVPRLVRTMVVVVTHRSLVPSLAMDTPALDMEVDMVDTRNRADTTSNRLASKVVVAWEPREQLRSVLEVDCSVVCSLPMPLKITMMMITAIMITAAVTIMAVVVMTSAAVTSKPGRCFWNGNKDIHEVLGALVMDWEDCFCQTALNVWLQLHGL